ncbi:MAG: transposase [Candidatus Omnitrophota bacterium]
MKNRKRNRLKNYDYAQAGYYFVTVCAQNREECFGKIVDSQMILNSCGAIAQTCWFDLPNHYHHCGLDEFIIMPNHIHGIVMIKNDVGTGFKPVPTYRRHSLSEIIRGFKTFSSKKINASGRKIRFHWQRSFYDSIIRNKKSLNTIREYMRNNPLRWEFDRNNPRNSRTAHPAGSEHDKKFRQNDACPS